MILEKSTVYFTNFRCPVGTSQIDKLKKLCIAAGIRNIDMDGKFVAIKMHFGELGNLAFLRPQLCKKQWQISVGNRGTAVPDRL